MSVKKTYINKIQNSSLLDEISKMELLDKVYYIIYTYLYI